MKRPLTVPARRRALLTAFFHRLRLLDRRLRARLSLLRPAGGSLLAATRPMVKLEYQSGVVTDRLIVFLPGIGDLPEDFERHGFIDQLRRHHGGVDAVALDAHFGYYATRSIFERITDDVLVSARTAGYRELWLAGISLGGFGAASYAARHAGAVEGIILLAPYLGEKTLTDEISSAGGVQQWNPGKVAQSDHARQLWAWIKARTSGAADAIDEPRIYLGYGSGDRFAPANRLLADALPKERVFVVPGGHNWRTWKRVWRLLLEAWPGV